MQQDSESRIGVCSWSLRPRTPNELLEHLHQLGIHAVQLALRPVLEARMDSASQAAHAGWHDAPATLAGGGIRIMSGMMAFRGEDYSTLDSIRLTGGVRPDESWDENLEHARRTAAMARDLGLSLVTFHAGFIPHDAADPLRAVMFDRLRAVADMFIAANVQVAFETGQETADTLLDALTALACPNVGVNFDPGNMILYGMGDPVAALRSLSEHVVQIHIKDAVPTQTPGQWGREVPAGQGAVDWPAFFDAVRHLRQTVNLVIEREAGEHRVVEIAMARDLVRSHLCA